MGADGIAFVVQNDPAGASALGGGGGGIGFLGVTKSVAVQFDTWCNPEVGDTCVAAASASPTSADQITVESCGTKANTVTHGTACEFGTKDLSTLDSPIYLADGNQHTVQIMYKTPPSPGAGCTNTGSPDTAGCGSITVTVDTQKVLYVGFDLASLGLAADSGAFVGFTGATGASFEEQDIVNWSFSAQPGVQPRVGNFNPTSGALLTIIGHLADNTPVKIYRYDSQIHSGTVQTVPVGNGLSNCNSTDAMYPTDAYVLQGGSWTGCDGGDAFEVTDNNTNLGSQKLGVAADIGADNQEAAAGTGFKVETHYCVNGAPCNVGAVNGNGQRCNTALTVCANPDTGFVQVTNNTGKAFTGTITLSGNPATGAPAPCPAATYPIFDNPPGTVGAGTVLDSSGAGLLNTAAVTLSMGGDSSSCGGFNAPQIALMQNGSTFQYNIGKDLFKFLPVSAGVSLHGNVPEYLEVLPVPVPAGPLGNPPAFGTFGPFGGSPVLFDLGEFGQETPTLQTAALNLTQYPNQACIPIASFSGGNRVGTSTPIAGATKNPVCPEIQIDALQLSGGVLVPAPDSDTFIWSATVGFTADPIVGAGIGGVHSLTQHHTECPGTFVDMPGNPILDSLVSYTGDPPGIDFPGRLGNSCILDTYEPGTPPTANTVTVGLFQGFQLPVLNCPSGAGCSGKPQSAKSGSSIPLIWTSQTSAGIPLTPPALGTPSLQLCKNNSAPMPPICGDGILPNSVGSAGSNTFWVWMGFVPTVCSNGLASGGALDDPGSSLLQYLGPPTGTAPKGTWQFNWKTTGLAVGTCATPVMIFSTGMVSSEVAEFVFTH
jgi:hypothetical protein